MAKLSWGSLLFLTAGFELFDKQQDTLALAAVTTLLLGCRVSEVVHLKVRDLDCGGTRLWIAAQDSEYRGKTRNAARNPEVPDALRPRLLHKTVGRQPEDYLFGASARGCPSTRQALHQAVRRVCLNAGVPVVCPHSLRGLRATAGVRSGALSHAVAAALGHGSFKITAQHYVQPGTLDGVRTERLVEMLTLKQDVMETLQRLFGTLRLRINEAKSAIAHPWERSFLGYTFFVTKKQEIQDCLDEGRVSGACCGVCRPALAHRAAVSAGRR